MPGRRRQGVHWRGRGYTVGGVQQLPQADCILLPLPLEQSGLPLAQLLGMAKPGGTGAGR